MKLIDLTFEQHIPDLGFGGLIRAAVTFPNGYSVSIISGPLLAVFWEPGLFEAAILSPVGGEVLHHTVERGDEHAMNALLARVAAFPPPPDIK